MQLLVKDSNTLKLKIEDLEIEFQGRYDDLEIKNTDLELRYTDLKIKYMDLQNLSNKQLVELSAESKAFADGYVNELKSRLAEEEAASLIVKEESKGLQETLEKMGLDHTESLDRIAVLESQITLDKMESCKLAEAFSELKGRFSEEKAASLILKEHSVGLQETIDEMMAQKMSVDDQIVELMTQAESDKVSAVGLQETIDKMELDQMDRIAMLESQITRDKTESYELAEALSELKSRLIEEEAAAMILNEYSVGMRDSLGKMELEQTESLNRMITLEGQITNDKAESDELAGAVSGLKGRLVEEEEASLILKENSKSLKETLEKMELDHTESLDRIAALESQITLDKMERHELAEALSRLAEEEAASLILKEQSTSLQESIDEMVAQKMSVDDQIVELMTRAESDKVSAVGLQDTIEKMGLDHTESLNRIAVLESQITSDKMELNKLKTGLAEEGAASMILKENSISLQGMHDELLVAKQLADERLLVLESLVKEEQDSYVTLEAQLLALQETYDEVFVAKQIADDRIAELDSQMIRNAKQLDEIAAESKITSDGYVNELKIRLAEKEAASLILKEHSVGLQETIDKMELGHTESLNRIAVDLDKTNEVMLAQKVSVDIQIVELRTQAESDKVSAVGLRESLGKMELDHTESLNRMITLEVQIANDTAESVKLLEALSEFKGRLAEEEAASQILKEEIVSLQETVKDMSKSSDVTIVELKSRLAEEDAASLILKEHFVCLQETIDEMVAQKISVDDQIVELMTQAETVKLNTDELLQRSMTSKDRILELESFVKEEQETYATLSYKFDLSDKTREELLQTGKALEEQCASLEAQSVALQERYDESSVAKQIADDRIADLIQTDKVLEEQCASLQKSLDEIVAERMLLSDQIVEMETCAEAYKVNAEELLQTGKVFEERCASLERSLDEVVGQKVSLDNEIIDLVKQAEADRVILLRLAESLDRIAALESQIIDLRSASDELVEIKVASNNRITELEGQLVADRVTADDLLKSNMGEYHISIYCMCVYMNIYINIHVLIIYLIPYVSLYRNR
jgi:chromosome segregation ATPase